MRACARAAKKLPASRFDVFQFDAEIVNVRPFGVDSIAAGSCYFGKGFHLPLAVEAGESCLAGEELLHGGLFEVALLGDELVQRAEQRIHIAQRPRDGALFGETWNDDSKLADSLNRQLRLCAAERKAFDLLFNQSGLEQGIQKVRVERRGFVP